jgi:hypothetical protein
MELIQMISTPWWLIKWPKPKLSIEKLTKDGTLKVIKYPNLFIAKDRTFAQNFIKKMNLLMANNISTNES